MVLHGDFFANKGAALIKVDVPITGASGTMRVHEVLLYTTHLVAIYQKVSELPSWRDERYLPYRLSQAISLAEFITNTSKPSDTIIIGGDFNSSQRSLEVQMLLILLKRRGYTMRSVLPTPSTILETATSNMERAVANSTYTFSNKNAFNCCKTSYFKLLNMQSDIPSQIDHVFFNHAHLSLQPFEQCPDADPNYPFYVTVGEKRVPSGVVVFTENQVRLPPSVPLARKVALLLESCAGSRRSYLGKNVRCFTEWLAPHKSREEAEEDSDDDELALYPLSDHYGVAARFVLRAAGNDTGSPGPDHPLNGDAPTAVSLTEDEVMVVNSVVQFLESFTDKLKQQAGTSRYLALSCLATLLLHLYVLRNALDVQRERTAGALQQLYYMSESGKLLPKVDAEGQTSSLRRWVVSALRRERGESSPHPPPDFGLLAEELTLRPRWLSMSTAAVTNVVLSFTGIASFGIGMIQRMGNYNVLKEQVRQLLNT
ncbi:inositol phosphosphingolipid phospholipase C [Strigomonas culicis]|nr:inositol phosphosphingolipid phospholipase C [Strigomonas culicis]|eukprot:EPY26253.1 inositol phosphosphingolipid phospholipase C [Strigomonas culicis]